MVRTVTQKYQIWLAGYYDDFNGARAIPDYKNTPSSTSTYTHLASHYGNPLNGEAFLNPRYRWSVEERAIDSNKVAGNSSRVSGTSPVNNFLMNDGLFEWLTFDDTRLGKDDYEGRIHLQYPDGHVANRYKFNNDSNYGSDFYQRFINGHNSDASYIVPVGDNDASFGRSDMKRYTEANYEDKNGGITSTTGNFVQRAHLTGVWMGEQLEQADIADTTPSQLFAELKSPSGQPFLCVQTVRKHIDNDSASVPAIIYDGPLNTRLDGDTFTARIAVRGFMASNTIAVWDDMKVRFEIGFPLSQAGILNDEGYTGAAAIDFTLDLADISYDTQGLLYSGSSLQSYTNDNSWIDVDFVFDYSNNKFKAYHNGTEITSANATAGSYISGYALSATASNLYGYQISIESDETDGTYGYVSYLMLDRAGLVRYLTDDFTSSDEALVDKLSVKQSNNGISSCSVKLHDDPALTGGSLGNAATDYLLNLRGLFVSSTPIDWSLLVFADTDNRIDRPVWRGTVDTFSITQKARGRELDITAKDSLDALNNQIPLWDVGQKAQNETGDDTTYWSYSAQGFRDAMYLGAGKLKLLNNDVGFDADNTFLETSTQRTQLGSGHPIQMYNNENTNTGPNSIEDFYEGVGIRSIQENRSASVNNIDIRLTSVLHGLTGGETVSIQNSNNHDDTSVTVVTASASSATITVSGLTYSPESAEILYAGPRKIANGASSYVNDDGTVNDEGNNSVGFLNLLPQGTTAWDIYSGFNPHANLYTGENGPYYLNFIFSADPNLKIGDKFTMNKRDKSHALSGASAGIKTAYEQIHRVTKITKFRNYFTVANYTEDSVFYFIETDTRGGVPGSDHYGDISVDGGLLEPTQRYEWTKEQGILSGAYISGSNHVKAKHRAIHARWMRDLPESLWFKYHYGLVEEDPVNNSLAQQHLNSQTIARTTGSIPSTSIIVPQTTYDNIPSSGVAEIWTNPSAGSQVFQEKFIYQGKSNVSGTYRLLGCKYINNIYTVSGNNYVLKVQSISSDYKHIWLLWSDMRNNGLANADGSFRKKSFGLQYPLSENYDFDLFYIDQVDAEGNIDKFASLKAGDDLDIWNLDSTADPCTGGPFSKPVDYANSESCTIALANTADLRVSDVAHGLSVGDYIYIFNSAAHDGHYQITAKTNDTFDIGSAWTTGGTGDTGNTGGIFYAPITGSHKDLTKYQDWEDKAGSFLVVDSSPFFNLNTHTNGGKTGQIAGGNTDLTDYVATTHGFPALIDNYWAEALPSYQTVDDGFREHPNQDKLISDAQISPEGLIQYDCGITVDDATKYDDAGIGIIKVVYDRNSNENDTTQYFFSWKNKLETLYTKTGNNSGSPDVTWEGISAVTLSHGSGTHEASGVRPGMILKRTDGTSGAITRHTVLRLGDATNVGERTGANTDTTIIVSKKDGDMDNGTTVTWAINDTYEIPVQLGHIQIINDTYSDLASFKTFTLEERERAIQVGIDSSYDGTWATIGNRNLSFTTNADLETTPSRFEVHATITSSFMLRLMMHIDGYYEAKNSGTYFNNDKFRFLWNAAITDSWLPSAKVPCIFDINNVPVTSMMTTYNDTSSNDSYGSVVDSRGKSLGSLIKDLGKKSGYGTTNSIKTTFSALVGRDNRIEFRPKYNSGVSLTRSNSMISKISAKVAGQVTNVRVYYNDNQSFVDFPATNLTDTTRWKILEHPKIRSSREALIVAQQQYSTYSNTALSMNVSPIMESGAENKMIETGRYGYIADPYIALRGTNDNVANCTNWTYLGTGGALFPGMVNGLHGNMSTNDASARNDDSVSRYGISQDTGTGDVSWETNYYWYGSNSISNAVQIVHIPNSVPFVSDSSSEPLRIWVDLKNQTGTRIDESEFTVHIADYRFNATATKDLHSSQYSNNTSSKDVKHSGYYEIDVPQSYSSSQGKIVFSFNAEYCRALLRRRCGDPSQTAHGSANYILDSSVDNGSGSVNANSIFPIGMRPYTEMYGGFRNTRKEWYAPRIQICRDLSYVPATYVSVTDLGLEMNAQTMVIKDITWGATSSDVDNLQLALERDESLSSQRLMDYLLNKDTDGLQQGGGGGNASGNPIYGGTVYIPPHNFPTIDLDPDADQQVGDGYEDFDADSFETDDGMAIGKMSKKSYGNLKGRMSLPGDNLSGGATFSVLGQQKPAVIPSTMRGIEGMDVDISIVGGTASRTADGFIFAGKGLQAADEIIESQEVSLETSFVVPDDILSNRMSIQANITHSPLSASGKKCAVLFVIIHNEKAGVTVSNEVKIYTGTSNQIIDILPEKAISGLRKSGNRIMVRITRKPGTGSDTADATSVLLKSLSVKMQRASANTGSSADKFSASRT